MLQPGLLYVNDRGYVSFELMRAVLDAGSSFITRVQDDIAVSVQEERERSPEAAQAGVIRDVILRRLGTAHHKDIVGRPMRLVIVRFTERTGQLTELWPVGAAPKSTRAVRNRLCSFPNPQRLTEHRHHHSRKPPLTKNRAEQNCRLRG